MVVAMETTHNQVKVITKTIVKPGMKFEYPAVACLKNYSVQQRINLLISAEINRMLADTAYCETVPDSMISGWYEIKTNINSVLSLSQILYYYCGGAHGMTINRSMTFNTDTSILYELKDLFIPGSSYMQKINDIINKQIIDRGLSESVDFKGISSNQDYYIAQKSLVVYFQLYEITNYAAGFLYFPISIYELGDIVRKGAPLDLMLNYPY